MGGTVYNVYDEKGNGPTIGASIDYEKYAWTADSSKEYFELIDAFLYSTDSLWGEKVRVTGVVGLYYMERGWADPPMLVVNERGIEGI